MFKRRMQVEIPNEILLAEVGEILAEGKEVVLLTKGDSMNPLIRGGRDSVLLRKVPDGELKVGDVALARIAQGHFVLHRIISIVDGDVTLMGDGNVRGREHCSLNDILGVAVKVIKKSGREVKVGRAPVWRRLGYFPRRILLAFHRRLMFRIFK